MVKRTLLAILMVLTFVGFAHADLTSLITDVNADYHGDIRGFINHLADRYPSANGELRMVVLSVDSPADAVVSLWLEEQAQASIASVLQSYQQYHAAGWGQVLDGLGIDRSSPLANALFSGELNWNRQAVIVP